MSNDTVTADRRETLSRAAVLRILRDLIASESPLPQDFHKGRVSALSFALDLIESMEGGEHDSLT